MIETGYKVTYNGLAPWGSGARCFPPFVSVSIEENWASEYLGSIRTVTLNGTIPSGQISNTINAINSAFSSNFKPFSAPNIFLPSAIIDTISFGDQNYIGKVDYTITLRDFSGFLYGVSDPVDEITYDEGKDGTVSISHRLSARGIATGTTSEAFEQAKLFVLSRTGVVSDFLADGYMVISVGDRDNMILLSQQEIINRVDGSYGIVENFLYDPIRGISGNICKRFSSELNSGITDDYLSVSVNGLYRLGQGGDTSVLKSSIYVDELYQQAIGVFNAAGLNQEPVSWNIEVNETGRELSVKAVFDNSRYESFFDYEVDAQKDLLEDLTQINIKGVIQGSGRHIRKKYETSLEFFNSGMGGWNGLKSYLYSKVLEIAPSLGYSDFTYNPIPKSISVNFNSGQGIISINSTFDNSQFVSGYADFSWGASTDCGLNVFKPFASANKNGSYLIQDLNIINRSSVNLNGDFAFPISGSSANDHANILSYLTNLEGLRNSALESENYSYNSGENIRSGFNYNYTQDGCALSVLPIDGKIYTGIRI